MLTAGAAASAEAGQQQDISSRGVSAQTLMVGASVADASMTAPRIELDLSMISQGQVIAHSSSAAVGLSSVANPAGAAQDGNKWGNPFFKGSPGVASVAATLATSATDLDESINAWGRRRRRFGDSRRRFSDSRRRFGDSRRRFSDSRRRRFSDSRRRWVDVGAIERKAKDAANEASGKAAAVERAAKAVANEAKGKAAAVERAVKTAAEKTERKAKEVAAEVAAKLAEKLRLEAHAKTTERKSKEIVEKAAEKLRLEKHAKTVENASKATERATKATERKVKERVAASDALALVKKRAKELADAVQPHYDLVVRRRRRIKAAPVVCCANCKRRLQAAIPADAWETTKNALSVGKDKTNELLVKTEHLLGWGPEPVMPTSCSCRGLCQPEVVAAEVAEAKNEEVADEAGAEIKRLAEEADKCIARGNECFGKGDMKCVFDEFKKAEELQGKIRAIGDNVKQITKDAAEAEGLVNDLEAVWTAMRCPEGTFKIPHAEIAPSFGVTLRAVTASNVCVAHTICSPSEWQTKAVGEFHDRTCVPHRQPCAGNEYEVTPPGTHHDRACKTHLAPCASTEWEMKPPGSHQNRECAPTTICAPTQWQQQDATYASDRVCRTIKQCNSTEWETVAYSATSDRECAPHRTCLLPAQPHGAGQFIATEGGAHNDRVCEALATCDYEQQWESAAAGSHNNRVCAPLSTCSATQWVIGRPTESTDRACEPLSQCSGSQYETSPPGPFNDRTCATHKGVCKTEQWQTEAPSSHRDRRCARLRTCWASEWVVADPVATGLGVQRQFVSNRVCQAYSPTCDFPRRQYESRATDTHHDRTCTDLTTCTADEYEHVPSTSTSDRVCHLIKLCSPSQYISLRASRTADCACSPLRVCNRATEYESVAPTKYSDRQCTAKKGRTDNEHYDPNIGCCDPRVHTSTTTFCKIQNHRCERSIDVFGNGTPTYHLLGLAEDAPHSCEKPGKCVPCPPSMGQFRSIRVSHAAHSRLDVRHHRCAMTSATECSCCDCRNGLVAGVRAAAPPPTPVSTAAPTPGTSPPAPQSFFFGVADSK
jgi:hypothetical protein